MTSQSSARSSIICQKFSVYGFDSLSFFLPRNIESVIRIASGPEVRMIPMAPPLAVEIAQIVDNVVYYLNSFKYYANKVVNLIFVACIHFFGITVCYDNATCHCFMSKN